MRWRVLALTVCTACANLPALERDSCGNAVLELGEDCDSLPETTLRCLPPGEDGACHFDCSVGSAGVRWQCPAGWACDFDELCRRPTGAFEQPIKYTVGGVSSLAAGDFDGDGRFDVLSRNPTDLAGRATLSFHYFNERAALVDTRPFPKLMVAPAIGMLSNDGRNDLAFSDFRVGVMLGRADRSWVPEAFTPYVIDTGQVRLTGVREGSVGMASPLASLATISEGPGIYVPDLRSSTLALRARVSSPLDTLVGEPVDADVIEGSVSPCDELVLAFRGETALQVYELCDPQLASGEILWRAVATRIDVPLEPPAPLDAAPLSADLNGDGHLDLLVGAGGLTYAAFSDGQRLSSATPYRPSIDLPGQPAAEWTMPLAVGDMSADGEPDFVLADRVLMSQLPPGSTQPRYDVVQANSGGRWTSAKIADLNGNGFLDAVAAQRGRLHIDFFNGSGKPWLLDSRILTTRSVSLLTVSDFDGDLIGDLALVEKASGDQELDAVKVAFGELSTVPGAPVTVARTRSVQQIGPFHGGGTDGMFVVADYPTPGDKRSLVYLLGGNAERIPFAALELITFTQDGRIDDAVAMALTLGAFTGPAPKDLVVLSFELKDGTWAFWLVPTLDGPSPSPLRLRGTLDPRLSPSATIARASEFQAAEIYATCAAADLNRDGRDETIWVMPADQGARCGIQTFSVSGQASDYSLVSGGVVTLDAPCTDPQISAVDADQDGVLDLAVLTGSVRGSDRKLFVLWNDGSGHFAVERSTLINSNGDSPQAFTSILATVTTPFSFVYASETAVVQWRYAGARTFGAASTLATLRRGTGIVAADLDGDGAVDLAVADDGDISVLSAQLK